MKRREFIGKSALASAAAVTGTVLLADVAVPQAKLMRVDLPPLWDPRPHITDTPKALLMDVQIGGKTVLSLSKDGVIK